MPPERDVWRLRGKNAECSGGMRSMSTGGTGDCQVCVGSSDSSDVRVDRSDDQTMTTV